MSKVEVLNEFKALIEFDFDTDGTLAVEVSIMDSEA